ncbi:hypothetical protein, partial [Treponema sp. Marseille-Q4132]|uniref:hypothetical protein n=1 Tax=Treponema sp. Marseille-Q4132 TaxID=2766701 RepID=UPI001C070605
MISRVHTAVNQFSSKKYAQNAAQILDTHKYTPIITRNSQLATRNSQLATRNSQLATRNSQLATRNSQLATRNSQLA